MVIDCANSNPGLNTVGAFETPVKTMVNYVLSSPIDLG